MTTLTEKFDALETQLAAQAATTNAYIDTVETKLQALFDTLDIMLVNNAANTKALIAAIGQNSPCAPCPTPPLSIPPVGTITLPVDEEGCKRSQAFLNFMQEVFTVLDLASSVGVGFNPSLITDAFNQVIASIGGGDSPDAISFPEAVQLVGDMVSYVATNILVGDTLVGLFSPLYVSLRNALYSAGSASAAKSAYDAIIDASSMDGYRKAVLKDAAYGAAYTYFFDPASDPDLSGLSGTVCSFVGDGCVQLVNGHFEGTDTIFVNQTETGYDYYHTVITNPTGNINWAVWVNDVYTDDGVGGAIDLYWVASESFRFQVSTFFPGGGDILFEGCFGEPPS